MFGALLLKHVKLRPNTKVLDVGCGTGFPLLELAQRLGTSCLVYGIDKWRTALCRAKWKAGILGIPNVEVIGADAAVMPFEQSTFDLIVSNLGLNNFENPQAALEECWRVARSNAQIVLTTNLRGHMKEFYKLFSATLKELGRHRLLDNLRTHIEHRTTIESICQMLEKVGFRRHAIHQEVFAMRFVDGSTMLRHTFIKKGFLGGWRSVVTPEDEKEVFIRLENNLNRLAANKGELELTIPMAYVEGEKID
jgi:ubiquinone/menaquinone biosynthesis C-methylase UbiE